MIKRSGIILIILSCVFAAGCAPSVYRKPITIQNRKLIQSDYIVVSTDQRTIDPAVNKDDYDTDSMIGIPENANPVAAGAGGIIGDVVADFIMKGVHHHELTVATKKITPIRNNLGNFEFMPLFENAVAINLQGNTWLKIKNSELKNKINQHDFNSLLNNPKYNTVLFVKARYALDQYFHMLMVNVSVSLDYKAKNSRALKPLYKNHFEYFSMLDATVKSRKAAIQMWENNHDALLKSKLTQSAQLIGKMIELDINNPQSNLYKNMNTPVIHFISPYIGRQSGKIVAKINSDWIVRTADDALHAFHATSVLKNKQ